MTPPWPTTPPTAEQLRGVRRRAGRVLSGLTTCSAGSPPAPGGRRRRRPVHRRWRLHRAVGGAARQASGPRAIGRAGRGRALRRGRQRTQRRVPRRVADARAGQRPEPLRASEMPMLARLGAENFAGLPPTWSGSGSTAEYDPSGSLTSRWSPPGRGPAGGGRAGRRFGHDAIVLDADAIRAQLRLADVSRRAAGSSGTTALVHPGKLGDGLRRAAASPVCACSSTAPCTGLELDGAGVRVRSAPARSAPRGTARHQRLPAAARGPLRHFIAPVYDYALMTEPLSGPQLPRSAGPTASGIGDSRQPVSLLPTDARQPDPVRRLRRGLPLRRPGRRPARRASADVRDALPAFLHDLPAAAGLCASPTAGAGRSTPAAVSRVFFGTALDGRVSYAVGYTGLGVGCDPVGRAGGARSARRPRDRGDRPGVRAPQAGSVPAGAGRSAVIALTRNRLAAADRREGRRGVWLGALDRLGLGLRQLRPGSHELCGQLGQGS